jgi:hypothetical protein
VDSKLKLIIYFIWYLLLIFPIKINRINLPSPLQFIFWIIAIIYAIFMLINLIFMFLNITPVWIDSYNLLLIPLVILALISKFRKQKD